MNKVFRWFSVALFVLALAGVTTLWITDAFRSFQPGLSHQHTGAFPLMLIGVSYISFQLYARSKPADTIKGILLGLAFVLWGAEQLLPPAPMVTAMDGVVISIFVIDVALIIVGHLRRKGADIP